MGLLFILGAATAGRVRPMPLALVVLALCVSGPFWGFKSIAETTWLRAVAGVFLSAAFYAVAIAAISLVFGWWRPHLW